MTYTSSPVLGWDYKSGPGDMFYVGSGGNTAMASQMALVVSDGHGVKIGKSGYDGTDYDISSSDEYLRIDTSGRVMIGRTSAQKNLMLEKHPLQVVFIIMHILLEQVISLITLLELVLIQRDMKQELKWLLLLKEQVKVIQEVNFISC